MGRGVVSHLLGKLVSPVLLVSRMAVTPLPFRVATVPRHCHLAKFNVRPTAQYLKAHTPVVSGF